MTRAFQHYVGGEWLSPSGGAVVEVADPNTGGARALVPCGSPEDARLAVGAAAGAFPGWARTPLADRVNAVRRLADALSQRMDELARAMAGEVGTPLKIAHHVQTLAPIRNCENFIRVAEQFAWKRQVAHSLVVREPVGVVACITPWNFPLHQIVLKVVPALLGGNTVVLKPSELTPETTQLFCEAVHEAGFPPGVMNCVIGAGPDVGMPLVQSPDVHMVSFTGSTRTGQEVMRQASATVKKVSLELGGKSPSVILPGADLQRAVKATLSACMLNNGQTCSALTRMLIAESQREEVRALVAAEFEKMVVGSSLESSTRIGPLVSAAQQKRARALIQQGMDQGALVIASGTRVPSSGFFVGPLAVEVRPDNILAREEIFGPVLSVLSYASVEQAVAMANDTEYGLAAAVWGDAESALAVAAQLRAGQVDVNGAPFNPLAPFGGYGFSGIGREGGEAGLEEFLEIKSIQLPPEPAGHS